MPPSRLPVINYRVYSPAPLPPSRLPNLQVVNYPAYSLAPLPPPRLPNLQVINYPAYSLALLPPEEYPLAHIPLSRLPNLHGISGPRLEDHFGLWHSYLPVTPGASRGQGIVEAGVWRRSFSLSFRLSVSVKSSNCSGEFDPPNRAVDSRGIWPLGRSVSS